MEKYNTIRTALTKIQFILDEMKDTIYQGKIIGAVELKVFGTVTEKYFSIHKDVNELMKLTDGIMACSNESEMLEFFLNNIYNPELSEDII